MTELAPLGIQFHGLWCKGLQYKCKNATQDYRLPEHFLDINSLVQLNQMILGGELGPEEMEHKTGVF